MFKLEFCTKNNGFSVDAAGEISAIFAQIKAQTDQGRSEGVVRDSDGNRIGEWSTDAFDREEEEE